MLIMPGASNAEFLLSFPFLWCGEKGVGIKADSFHLHF